jgi:hypothetical protein
MMILNGWAVGDDPIFGMKFRGANPGGFFNQDLARAKFFQRHFRREKSVNERMFLYRPSGRGVENSRRENSPAIVWI